jgi:hypothetical protein
MPRQNHLRPHDSDPATNPIKTENPSDDPPPTKRIQNFPLFVRSCQQKVATTGRARRPIPIRVDNGLLHIRLRLGPSDDTALSVLFDSGAALSSGYLSYHLWIMREHPNLVTSFERFDDANPFKPIKLGGAIRHPDDYNESLHGQLTAIIRYKTPYIDTDENPVHISFGLGNDMTVNTILGMPIIKDLGMIPNFCAGSVTCEGTSATFTIDYHETKCGFLASDADTATFSMLPVDQIYPPIRSDNPLPDDTPAAPCVNATDDLSQGYLQWHLH